MRKKIMIILAVVLVVVIVNVVVFQFLGNDNKESVEYDGGHNVTEKDNAEDAPVVYMATDISSDSLIKVYEALSWEPSGNVAVKLSTGEPPASNYLDPNLAEL